MHAPRTLTRIAGGTTIAAALLVSATGIAGAAPTPSGERLDTARAACTDATTKRIDATNEALAVVGAAEHLTDAHRSALSTQLSADVSGLTSLQGQIQGATDIAGLRDACRQIGPNFRIFLLQLPKTHYTIAADRAVALADDLSGDVHDKLADAIAKAKAKGVDTSAEEASLADLQAKATAAKSAAAGVGDAVLPLTPQQIDDGSAKPVLQSSRDALGTARQDLGDAVKDAKSIVAGLKAAKK